MKKKKTAAFLLCAAMIGTCLAGCKTEKAEPPESGNEVNSDESGKPEKITIISTTDDVGYFEYIGEQYTEEYGVEVEIISQAYEDRKSVV